MYRRIFVCNYILIGVCDSCVMWFVIEKWILNYKVVELHELCLSKLYLIYMTCISSCLVSILVRNVITHSLCVVCVWILWWSWTLCSGEQMIRWIALRNLVLKDVKTQCSDRMWHWCIGFYINCIKSYTTLFEPRWLYYLFGQV